MKETIDNTDFLLVVEFKVKNKRWKPLREDCENFVKCIAYGTAGVLAANGNHLMWFWKEFHQLCKKAHDRLSEFVT